MRRNLERLSHAAKAALLTRIAHQLTVCARDTYEPGTDNVLDPKVLRAYNELLHRVTASAHSHVIRTEGVPLKVILEMMDDFGSRFNRLHEIRWVIQRAEEDMSI